MTKLILSIIVTKKKDLLVIFVDVLNLTTIYKVGLDQKKCFVCGKNKY